MIKNEYGIIEELGGFTIPGSNKLFKTFEEAYAYASQYGRTKRTRAIDKLANIKITYDDIYAGGESHGFIPAEDIEYDADTSGGGFYQAFSGIWTSDTSPTGDAHTAYRTLGWLFQHQYDTQNYSGLRSLIDALKQETTETKDPVLNYALEVLDNLSDDYWQNNTFEE